MKIWSNDRINIAALTAVGCVLTICLKDVGVPIAAVIFCAGAYKFIDSYDKDQKVAEKNRIYWENRRKEEQEQQRKFEEHVSELISEYDDDFMCQATYNGIGGIYRYMRTALRYKNIKVYHNKFDFELQDSIQQLQECIEERIELIDKLKSVKCTWRNGVVRDRYAPLCSSPQDDFFNDYVLSIRMRQAYEDYYSFLINLRDKYKTFLCLEQEEKRKFLLEWYSEVEKIHDDFNNRLEKLREIRHFERNDRDRLFEELKREYPERYNDWQRAIKEAKENKRKQHLEELENQMI